MVPSSTLVRQETHWIEDGETSALADAFPTLRADLETAGLTRAEVVPCIDIFQTVTTDVGAETIIKSSLSWG